MTTKQQLVEKYAADNRACADIIAADPERYPGAMQTWAHAVVERKVEGERPRLRLGLVA